MLSLLTDVVPAPWKAGMVAIVIVVASLMAAAVTHHLDQQAYDAAAYKIAQQQAAELQAKTQESYQAGLEYAKASAAQTQHTITLIKKVPYAVTLQDDAACRLPDGVISLLNDAAAGADRRPIPQPNAATGKPSASPRRQ